jgi:hypothetical protein
MLYLFPAELRLLRHAQHVRLLEARLGDWAWQVHQSLQQVSDLSPKDLISS